MTLTLKEMEVYYGGETHGCISPGFGKDYCGQLVPPSSYRVRMSNDVFGCVRTEELKVVCGKATKLYTPSIVSQDTIVFVSLLAAFAAWLLWDRRRKRDDD